jgi:hypothetical protein
MPRAFTRYEDNIVTAGIDAGLEFMTETGILCVDGQQPLA